MSNTLLSFIDVPDDVLSIDGVLKNLKLFGDKVLQQVKWFHWPSIIPLGRLVSAHFVEDIA